MVKDSIGIKHPCDTCKKYEDCDGYCAAYWRFMQRVAARETAKSAAKPTRFVADSGETEYLGDK